MKKINCLIADDEEIARGIIESYVKQLDSLNLVGMCSNGVEVYNALEKQPVDLLFLDIAMPHLTGIDLLRTLKNPPAVILTTAFREFALQGYELNVVDYLLKPVSFERFIKAVEKVQSKTGSQLTENNSIQNKDNELAFIYVKSDKKMVRLALKDILYIEGLKDYVKIYMPDRSIITYRTLTSFEEKLSASQFLRVHRSYIVSLNHISAYTATEIEIGKAIIPIGKAYAKEVLKLLEA
ncbi:LytR/AlgR family response regulator transcription factor [Mucilaginibacter jinjuensis]|uniref:LytTR family DNA-binding domain-containing protein n=1 Tax=Mucilaginibacter jinjuensis TaxID=1176721 RepID=A0ABY7T9J9_9SPHI|nr:LytTR family DNA-binding domain-containing protein [Mucilaginibacter jinjuensis]WCT13096.1 LytTR family DNA-binding domain-containing protein [Mucilaginibacter jinjuensis]